MATRTIQRTAATGPASELRQYLSLGSEIKQVTKRRDEVKARLIKRVEEDHVVDEEKGHLIFQLDDPIETLDGSYIGFMKQRKVTQTFDEDKALELCESLDLDIEEYTSRWVDQEKIIRLYADGIISDEQFNSLNQNKVTFAFVPVKE